MSVLNEDARRMDHLDLANHVRISKARLREQVRTGEVTPMAVLIDPPAFLRNERLADFLEWCPMIGRDKVRRLNVRAARQLYPVNLLAPIGELTQRQREWLAEQLPALQLNSRAA